MFIAPSSLSPSPPPKPLRMLFVISLLICVINALKNE